MIGPISWTSDQRLCVEDCLVDDLAREYGTPLYITSESELASNLQRFQKALRQGWPNGDVHVLPAIKANSRIAVCAVLARETQGCDLFSEGELYAALRAGFDPRQMSLNGNSKLGANLDFLRFAISKDVRVTLDDPAELNAVETIAAELSKPVRVRVRMRIQFPKLTQATELGDGTIPTDLAMYVYRPGVPNEHLIPLGKRLIESPHVDFLGLHVHLARNHAGLEYWRIMMCGLARQLGMLKREWGGWTPSELDIGGGFAQTRDPCARSLHHGSSMSMEILKLLRPMPTLRQRLIGRYLSAMREAALDSTDTDFERVDGPSIEAYVEAVTRSLREELRVQDIATDGMVLEIEPGRALFGSAGVHVTRINQIKRQSAPYSWAWVVTDTSDSFFGSLDAEHAIYPYTVTDKPITHYDRGERLIADITGKSCNADRIVGNACLPGDIKVGDHLAFLDVGAYEEASASNFNSMPRPASVLVCGGRHHLIRRRETVEDVFSHDIVPDL